MMRSSLGTAANNETAKGPQAMVNRASGCSSAKWRRIPVDITASPIRVWVMKRMRNALACGRERRHQRVDLGGGLRPCATVRRMGCGFGEALVNRLIAEELNRDIAHGGAVGHEIAGLTVDDPLVGA